MNGWLKDGWMEDGQRMDGEWTEDGFRMDGQMEDGCRDLGMYGPEWFLPQADLLQSMYPALQMQTTLVPVRVISGRRKSSVGQSPEVQLCAVVTVELTFMKASAKTSIYHSLPHTAHCLPSYIDVRPVALAQGVFRDFKGFIHSKYIFFKRDRVQWKSPKSNLYLIGLSRSGYWVKTPQNS